MANEKAGRASSPAGDRKILGSSKTVQKMLELIGKVAPSKTNVLIIGESGTGKELVARMIHSSGPLREKPFVPVNCGAIPETLIESEMFGHKRGSFTGAVSDKMGLFEAANGGTLFLDEVGELPLSMQVKLLRAIQERSFRKVGGTEDIRVDVRIIAATNRDLEAAVAKGTFREDLYYRLNVILLKTPPLRERAGDIRILADAFLEKFTKKFSRAVDGFSLDALDLIENYPWPGNVRELENAVERAVTLETGARISVEVLPAQLLDWSRRQGLSGASPGAQASGMMADGRLQLPSADFSQGNLDLDRILAQVERHYLEAALRSAGGIKKKAADLLTVTFRSFRYRLAKQGMDTGGDEEA